MRLGLGRKMKTNKLPPATCGEAADRIKFKFEGDYGIHAHLMKEVAATLVAFGDTPVPEVILDRYDWERL